MKLTVIRHGPTEWNASRRFQGRSDVPLSARGNDAAGAIAKALQTEPFDRIYSSDLSRALETARRVGEAREVQIVQDVRLREFDFGRWEGLTWDEIVAAYPQLAGHGSTVAKRYHPEGGESFAQVCARIKSFLGELSLEYLADVAVVTHAGPLHAMFSVLQLEVGETPADNLSLRFTPGGITRLALENGAASILALDDLRHLDVAS